MLTLIVISRVEGWLNTLKQAQTDTNTYEMCRRNRGPTWVPYLPVEQKREIKKTRLNNQSVT